MSCVCGVCVFHTGCSTSFILGIILFVFLLGIILFVFLLGIILFVFLLGIILFVSLLGIMLFVSYWVLCYLFTSGHYTISWILVFYY